MNLESGAWHKTKRAVAIKCQLCRYWHKQRATVMRYRPEMDFDGSVARKFPGAATTGWCLWAHCRVKGGSYRYWFSAATQAEVDSWGRVGMGWS